MNNLIKLFLLFILCFLFLLLVLCFSYCSVDVNIPGLTVLEVPMQREKYNEKGQYIVRNNLLPREFITNGEYIESENGNFRLKLQHDGNIVLRNIQRGTSIWSTRTQNSQADTFKFKESGNLVLLAEDIIIWESDTTEIDASLLKLTNNGTLILYENKITWSNLKDY